MTDLAIIGGTGLQMLNGLEILRKRVKQTPYGEPSGPFISGEFGSKQVIFLARHGVGHAIPPHQINYRANLWALKDLGVQKIISVACVGGISPELPPSKLAIPDQIIDYTWSRAHTFFEYPDNDVEHVDFSYPYCSALRETLIQAAADAKLAICPHGTYGATQGPRLETAAEIDRLERDGCTMVGMTGMPEAALARELELSYATCAVAANWAAGRSNGAIISMAEIKENLTTGMANVKRLLESAFPLLTDGGQA